MKQYLSTIVPSLLLLLASSSMSLVEVPSQLLLFQFLSNIASVYKNEALKFCKAYQRNVLLQITKYLDHPSSHIRDVAVHTVNVWSILS